MRLSTGLFRIWSVASAFLTILGLFLGQGVISAGVARGMMLVGMGSLGFAALVWGWFSFRFFWWAEIGKCVECGYSLRALRRPGEPVVCPECGHRQR